MEYETIKLPGENWWMVKKKLTVGAQMASAEISAPYVQNGKGTPEQLFKKIPKIARLRMSQAMVLASTKAWSYSEEVSERVLNDEISADDYQTVLKRCNELYGSSPLLTGENSQKAS